MIHHNESNFIFHKTIDYDKQFGKKDEPGDRDFRFEYGKHQACAGENGIRYANDADRGTVWRL